MLPQHNEECDFSEVLMLRFPPSLTSDSMTIHNLSRRFQSGHGEKVSIVM
jgi:hypothetical protein